MSILRKQLSVPRKQDHEHLRGLVGILRKEQDVDTAPLVRQVFAARLRPSIRWTLGALAFVGLALAEARACVYVLERAAPLPGETAP